MLVGALKAAQSLAQRKRRRDSDPEEVNSTKRSKEGDSSDSDDDEVVGGRFVGVTGLVRPLSERKIKNWARSFAPLSSDIDGVIWLSALRTEAVIAFENEEGAQAFIAGANGSNFPPRRADGGVVSVFPSAISPSHARMTGTESAPSPVISKPDPPKLETSKPESAVLETLKPETPKPDTSKPDTSKPDASGLAPSSAASSSKSQVLKAMDAPGDSRQVTMVPATAVSASQAPRLPILYPALFASKGPDELFRKTRAVPPLYWQPVVEPLAMQRIKLAAKANSSLPAPPRRPPPPNPPAESASQHE
jgi:hypothetical protein